MISVVEYIATSRSAKTLEIRLRDANVTMPTYNDDSPEADAAWEYAASEYAKGTSGIAWVFEGNCVRPGNTWTDIERPALIANGNTKCIFSLRADTHFRQIFIDWQSDSSNYCWEELQYYLIAVQCLSLDEYGWFRQQGSTTHNYPFDGIDDYWYYGGEVSPSDPLEFLYSRAIDMGKNFPGGFVPADPDIDTAGQAYMHSFIEDYEWISGSFQTADFHVQKYPDYVTLENDKRLPYRDYQRCRLSLDENSSQGVSLRILPLGDSITYDFKSSDGNGYRNYLDELLSGNTVDFIGSENSGNMTDNNNEGHGGAEISNIASFATGSLKERPNVSPLPQNVQEWF